MPCLRPSFQWIAPLTQCHTRGLGDHRIAEELGELDRDSLWTARRVKRLRRKLGLASNNHRHPEFPTRDHFRLIRARIHAAKRGWGHILPWFDRKTKTAVTSMTAGLAVVTLLDLRPREVGSLDLLADRGPLTRRQLAAGLGGIPMLRRLLKAGLVVGARRVRGASCRVALVYALAAGVRRHERTLRKSGIEERISGVFRGGANLVRRGPGAKLKAAGGGEMAPEGVAGTPGRE
jgi:hypothetical protein